LWEDRIQQTFPVANHYGPFVEFLNIRLRFPTSGASIPANVKCHSVSQIDLEKWRLCWDQHLMYNLVWALLVAVAYPEPITKWKERAHFDLI